MKEVKCLVAMKCKVPGCTYNTDEDIVGGEEVVTGDQQVQLLGMHLQLLGFHVDAAHPKQWSQPGSGNGTGGVADVSAKIEKVARPQLVTKGGYAMEEDWDYFTFRWGGYKSMVNLGDKEKEHLGASLGDVVISNVYGRLGKTKYEALSVEQLLLEVKQLVVRS